MRKNIIGFTICSFLLVLASCKKDIDVLAIAKAGSTPATGFGFSNLDVLSVTVEATTTELDTAILVFNNSKYGSDTKVSIAVDSTIVDVYDSVAGKSYDYMPSDVFTVPATTTIPANSLQGSVKLTVNISKLLTYGSSFATGIRITTVSGGPGNVLIDHSILPIVIQVKNRYDGVYKVTGTMVDYSNAGLTGPYPWNVYLITSGSDEVQLFDNDYTKGIYHKIKSGAADSYYGSFGVVFKFDADGNVISVRNLYGQPASNGRSATLDPSGINKYDPTTGALDVKYWMDQPSVIAPHRTSFTEHYEYLGPRD